MNNCKKCNTPLPEYGGNGRPHELCTVCAAPREPVPRPTECKKCGSPLPAPSRNSGRVREYCNTRECDRAMRRIRAKKRRSKKPSTKTNSRHVEKFALMDQRPVVVAPIDKKRFPHTPEEALALLIKQGSRWIYQYHYLMGTGQHEIKKVSLIVDRSERVLYRCLLGPDIKTTPAKYVNPTITTNVKE
jgi:hypothetical protein